MKKYFDFCYLDGCQPASVVWYLVGVGVSERDRAAFDYVRRWVDSSSDVIFMLHTADAVSVKDTIARVIFPACAAASGAWLLSSVRSVTWLASFLRHAPAALLNSAINADSCRARHLVLAGFISDSDIAKTKFLSKPRHA